MRKETRAEENFLKQLLQWLLYRLLPVSEVLALTAYGTGEEPETVNTVVS